MTELGLVYGRLGQLHNGVEETLRGVDVGQGNEVTGGISDPKSELLGHGK